MDEDPLQRRIFFLTFVELLKTIFSQYTETCEVLLDYPKIGGDDVIKDYAKKDPRKLLHVLKSSFSQVIQSILIR